MGNISIHTVLEYFIYKLIDDRYVYNMISIPSDYRQGPKPSLCSVHTCILAEGIYLSSRNCLGRFVIFVPFVFA